jgi:hypothetical protein
MCEPALRGEGFESEAIDVFFFTTSAVCIYADIYDIQLSPITPCPQVPSDLIVILYIQLAVRLLFGDHVSHFLGWMASLNKIGCF